ncbi:glutamine amidotransferase [Sphingomonas sp. R647]|uniref:glutamine amidotransferase n=1 Tax=Sphingomonas sp. R647 TaxID=2875233 RepID=UPI001CD45351|nr:glutamine amidotransferase [Sphingomonas sp. R647]MCA1199748.1 glutamine amidotransferase [Sphingomonas sp. R647]
MRALVIRHKPYEGLAGFWAPITAAGYAIDTVDVDDPAFAALDFAAPDLLVLMGGPMGVYERDAHPWIANEVARLADRLAAGKPTLGVCLGAQLIAAALGAEVFAGPVKEVGFAPVALNDAGATSPLRHLRDVPILHWHGDTFDLPEGAELLASTPAYRNQAFRRGAHLLALQFHPEIGEDTQFEDWLDGPDDYVAQGGLTIPELRDQHERLGPAAAAAGRAMLGEWLAGL